MRSTNVCIKFDFRNNLQRIKTQGIDARQSTLELSQSLEHSIQEIGLWPPTRSQDENNNS